MSKFIVIEGLDGSGKSTQINLLERYFKSKNIRYKYIHFPRLETPIIGEMIAKFLRGELGNVDDVNPYLVALMYATDRKNANEMIKSWLNDEYLVLMDRYVYSNIAFQCAKVKSIEEKIKIKKWIKELEYEYNQIVKPDISLFLHVPFQVIEDRLKSKRVGSDRIYLQGEEDIHENNLVLQRNVEMEYLNLIKEDENFNLIECYRDDKTLFNPEDICNKIIKILEELRMV